MELTIWIQYDSKLGSDLFESEDYYRGQTKVVSEGVAIKYKSHYAMDAVDLPSWIIVSAYIGEHVALPIAVGVLSRYLYDKLKDRKQSKVTINNIPVEINAEKIEQLIINLLKKNENE